VPSAPARASTHRPGGRHCRASLAGVFGEAGVPTAIAVAPSERTASAARSRVSGASSWRPTATRWASRQAHPDGLIVSPRSDREAPGWPGQAPATCKMAQFQLRLDRASKEQGPDACLAQHGPGQKGRRWQAIERPAPPRSGGGDRSSRGRPHSSHWDGDQAAALAAASNRRCRQAVRRQKPPIWQPIPVGINSRVGQGAHTGSGAQQQTASIRQPAPTRLRHQRQRLCGRDRPGKRFPLFPPTPGEQLGQQGEPGRRLQPEIPKNRCSFNSFLERTAWARPGAAPLHWELPELHSIHSHPSFGRPQQFEVGCGGRRRTEGVTLACSSGLYPHRFA